MLPVGVELVEYHVGTDGFRQMQLAVNGELCPPIDDHISALEDKNRFPTEAHYFAYIAKRSVEFRHMFGDPRSPLPEDVVQQRLSTAF